MYTDPIHQGQGSVLLAIALGAIIAWLLDGAPEAIRWSLSIGFTFYFATAFGIYGDGSRKRRAEHAIGVLLGTCIGFPIAGVIFVLQYQDSFGIFGTIALLTVVAGATCAIARYGSRRAKRIKH